MKLTSRKNGIVPRTVSKGRPKDLIIVELPSKVVPKPNPKQETKKKEKNKTQSHNSNVITAKTNRIIRALRIARIAVPFSVISPFLDEFIDLDWLKSNQTRAFNPFDIISINREDSPCSPDDPLLIPKDNRPIRGVSLNSDPFVRTIRERAIAHFGSCSLLDYYSAFPPGNNHKLTLRNRRALRLLIEFDDFIPVREVANAIDEPNLSALYQALHHTKVVELYSKNRERYCRIRDKEQAIAQYQLDRILPPHLTVESIPRLPKLKPKTCEIIQLIYQTGKIPLKQYPNSRLRFYANNKVEISGQQGFLLSKRKLDVPRERCIKCAAPLPKYKPRRRCPNCHSCNTKHEQHKNWRCLNCNTNFPAPRYQPQCKCPECNNVVGTHIKETFYFPTEFGRQYAAKYFNWDE